MSGRDSGVEGSAAILSGSGGFYALSGLYLLLFTLIGIVAALLTSSQSLGLFAAVAVWALITFATPQFTSGLRPVASLNPITDPVSVSHSRFFRATSKAKPIAVNEQYKALSSRLLSQGNDVLGRGQARQPLSLHPFCSSCCFSEAGRTG